MKGISKKSLENIIDTALGNNLADLVIKNCNVVDVFSGTIKKSNIAISKDLIIGVGDYEGIENIDGEGMYAIPGLIDSHMHIESSYLRPEELGKIILPHGTTTVIADPHEIGNVCGLDGIHYMIKASEGTPVDFKIMMPSCVPATEFEDSGFKINASDMVEDLKSKKTFGLGEFMNYPGIINKNNDVLDKIIVARKYGVIIDGHSPGLKGNGLTAYVASGVSTDHECETIEEMNDRISRGMYVIMRQGSACHNLESLIKGINQYNSRRCLLCTDDCQPRTIFSKGHIDNILRMCVANGVDAINAIQMATINASECYGLNDRGAIVPGRLADIVIVDNLNDFTVKKVIKNGKVVAEDGNQIVPIAHYDFSSTIKSFNVKQFSKEKLRLNIKSKNAYCIKVSKGSILTEKVVVQPMRNDIGDFIYDKDNDIAKISVIERHHGTGKCAVGLISGYGIKYGAIAVSVAHDSHNIIVVGTNDDDMEKAVNTIISDNGGIVIVKDNVVLEKLPLPIAGLISDKDGEYVDKKIENIHCISHKTLGINKDIEPIMTLCFMSLPVIPSIKITDRGIFDVDKYEFIDIEK